MSLASADLVGLFTRKDMHCYLHTYKPKDLLLTYTDASPRGPHNITALQEESRGKTASPLTMTPHSPNTGVNPKHKAAFGANCNAFCSKFTNFSNCHPHYHENTLYLATRHMHAISAALSIERQQLPSCFSLPGLSG